MTPSPTPTAPALPLAADDEAFRRRLAEALPPDREEAISVGLTDLAASVGDPAKFPDGWRAASDLLGLIGVWAEEHERLCEALAAERSAQSGWKSVRDELPPIGERVLVVVGWTSGPREYIARREGDRWELDDGGFTRLVSHWRPLPALRAEELR